MKIGIVIEIVQAVAVGAGFSKQYGNRSFQIIVLCFRLSIYRKYSGQQYGG